jgi:DNA-binding NtrC family response regulator
MHGMIVVVDANLDERQELCRLLEQSRYQTASMQSLAELLNHLQESSCHAVILDLDSLPVDNRFIRNLCKENPYLCVIGISGRPFHPELEEAIRTHISACLSKPVNVEELIYWLKSICGGEPSSRASPESRKDGALN